MPEFLEMIIMYKDLEFKSAELERKYQKHNQYIHLITDTVRQMVHPPEKRKKRVGFEKQGALSYTCQKITGECIKKYKKIFYLTLFLKKYF